MSTATEFKPGTRVKTPCGGAWVNVPPAGMSIKKNHVFVRLDDDVTRWFDVREVTLA